MSVPVPSLLEASRLLRVGELLPVDLTTMGSGRERGQGSGDGLNAASFPSREPARFLEDRPSKAYNPATDETLPVTAPIRSSRGTTLGDTATRLPPRGATW